VTTFDTTGLSHIESVPRGALSSSVVYKGKPLEKEVHTFKYSDRSWKIVDTSCGFQSSNYDTRRGDEIVCKGVVEIPLWQSVHVLGLPDALLFQ
jgi:hypothetical protein